MNALKTLVFGALLAVFAVFPAAAQSGMPTPEQVEKGDSRIGLSGYKLARDVLGKDFVTPSEVAFARNLFYSDRQLASFRDTLPSRDILEWLRANDYMLVAGPPTELSLLDVRKLNDAWFSSKKGEGWYESDEEAFSRQDSVGPIWLLLRKSPVPDSTDKTWNEQVALLSDAERVPNVAEVTWGLTTYKEVRGEYLMDNILVRTSSVDSVGNRVSIGYFGYFGLRVYYWWDDLRFDPFGVSSARKF